MLQYRGFAAGADAPATTSKSADGFPGAFGYVCAPGPVPIAGAVLFRGGARSVAERWQSGQNGWGQACLRGGARQL